MSHFVEIWRNLLEGKIALPVTDITNEELTQAWENWLYFHRGIHCEEVEGRFFTYCHNLDQSWVEACLDWGNGQDTYHVSIGTAERIRKCASSNFNALLEAYYINHPWDK